MIPNFPHPFPDELFYSWLARFQWLMSRINHSRVMRILFSGKAAEVAVIQPTRLADFAARLGNAAVNTEGIIRKHTLLPVYAPFLPPDRLTTIEAAMKGSGRIMMGSLAAGISVTNPDTLIYCPACAVEERALTGEAYWHRLHQVPGVLVCPTHNVFLESSAAPLRALGGLRAAEDVVRSEVQRKLNPSNPEHGLFRKIALDAGWLLENWIPGTGEGSISDRYLQLATRRGFVGPGGCILRKNVLREISQRYSTSLLEMLQCSIPEKALAHRPFWVTRLLHGSDGLQPPVRHLLFMDFLGISARDFFDAERHTEIFGTKLRACDNPFCPKTGQRVAAIDYRYNRLTKAADLRTTCSECGRISLRIKVGNVEKEKILEYGHAWDAELERLWPDSSLNFKDVASRLGMSCEIVKTQAIRLGLPSPRVGGGFVMNLGIVPRFLRIARRRETERAKKRAEWLALCKSQPTASCSELRSLASRCYGWLYVHDREWFKASPPVRRSPGSPWHRDATVQIEQTK